MVSASLTSREAESVASETKDLLEERDVVSLAVTGLSAAGGVIVAQMVADRVLSALDLNQDPESATDYVAAVLTKGVVAVGFGLIAAQLGGLGLIATGFMALGALASSGADLLEFFATNLPFGDNTTSSGLSGAASKATATVKEVTDGGASAGQSASANGAGFGSKATADAF